MSSQVIPSEDTEGLRLSKKRRKVKKAEASALRNRAFSERTRKKRAHEAKLAKADADRRSRDRELHEEKRKVISKQLQEKRDAAYAATSAKSKKEIQKEKDKKRQAKARLIKALRKKVEQCLCREQCLQECLQRGLNDMRALRRKYECRLRELTGVPELPVEDLTESPPHAPSTSTGTRPRPASNGGALESSWGLLHRDKFGGHFRCDVRIDFGVSRWQLSQWSEIQTLPAPRPDFDSGHL